MLNRLTQPLKQITPVQLFFGKAAGLWLLWEIFESGGFSSSTYVHHNLIAFLENATLAGLNFLRFETFRANEIIGIAGTGGVHIGNPCDGLSLMVLFAGLLVCYPGSVKSKCWYIPLGLLVIQALNLLRLIALAYTMSIAPHWLEFNHKYLFTGILYAIILGLWVWWINHFGHVVFQPETEQKNA